MFPYAATAINFYDHSEGKVKEWYWDFGEGNTSREQNPLFIFKHPVSAPNVKINPYRIVSLTILTDSCKSFYSITINILDGSTYTEPECQIYFGYSVNYDIKTFAPALVLDFYPRTNEKVKEWNWDFGDGYKSMEENPTHIFNLPLNNGGDSYTPNPVRIVTLTIKTDSGCVATWSDSINIYMNTTPPVEPDTTCHAWFKYFIPYDVVTIPEVKPYQLVDVSAGKVISRLWQFENGKTSTEAEPLVTFDIFKPTQKVCLTITTADSCVSTWCDVIYVSNYQGDTSHVTPPVFPYTLRISAYFPPGISSCAGYAHAEVYMGDSLVQGEDYAWSDGTMGQDVKNLCPTQTYTVKAKAADGFVVAASFIFNSDGSITEIPVSWWITGSRDQQVVWTNPTGKNLTVEWRLCDGTFVKSDTIPLASINCVNQESNLIVKDSAGNVIYTEKIAVRSYLTTIQDKRAGMTVDLFPNPVNETLHIRYSGDPIKNGRLEIVDMTGKSVILREMKGIRSGQQIPVDVSSLKKGIYLCKIILENQNIIVRKFTK